MKINYMRLASLSLVAGGVVMLSGCIVEPRGRVVARPYYAPPPPPVVYNPPPPYAPAVVVEPAYVPESYVWDGYEYVGFVNGGYFYLGPGNIWLACEPFRLERFHGWERLHPNWRAIAIRNDRYRADAHGRIHPRDVRRRDEGR